MMVQDRFKESPWLVKEEILVVRIYNRECNAVQETYTHICVLSSHSQSSYI